jgi:hypothetical protein
MKISLTIKIDADIPPGPELDELLEKLGVSDVNDVKAISDSVEAQIENFKKVELSDAPAGFSVEVLALTVQL